MPNFTSKGEPVRTLNRWALKEKPCFKIDATFTVYEDWLTVNIFGNENFDSKHINDFIFLFFLM
ncbi:hypothetical protein BH20BAC1_BH20BAC1_17150 [soil metagenome]